MAVIERVLNREQPIAADGSTGKAVPATDSGVLDRVRALLPAIAASWEEAERARCMPAAIVDRLIEAGLFRMALPKAEGGEELSVAQVCRVVEELAMADGAAGWTGMVGFGGQVCATRMARPLADRILTKGPDVLLRGAVAPTGMAVPTEGGFIVSGRWPFASGPYDPGWMMAACIVLENGAPRMAPNGMPETIIALLRPEQVSFLDTWDTVGLRGTNSSDFVTKDLFVPDEDVTPLMAWFGNEPWPPSMDLPLFHLPFTTITSPVHSAVVIGIAQAAVDELCALAPTKRRAGPKRITLAEDPVFQDKLGQIHCRLSAVRGLHETKVTEVTALAARGEQPTALFIARHSAWLAYIHTQCVDFINDAFTLAGTTAVYNGSRLQQRWRDARCAAQHVANSTAAFERLGALLAREQAA